MNIASNQAVINRVATVLPISLLSISIVITPSQSYDPVNVSKMLMLSTTAGLLLFLLLPILKNPQFADCRKYFYLIFLFACTLFIPVFLGKSPLNQQIWGTFGRNFGLVTQLSLVVLVIAGITSTKAQNFLSKFLEIQSLCSVFVISYAVLQIIGMDPFPWSSSNVFSTLGNPNFLAAYLGASLIISLFKVVRGRSIAQKLIHGTILVFGIWVLFEVESTQGIIIFAGFGSLLLIGLWSSKITPTQIFLGLVWSLTALLAFFGIFQRGPLSKFVFQETTLYRYDYWGAGIQAFIDNFLTGVGLDSYGDYYKKYRSLIAVSRVGSDGLTNPNRFSNSSHNMFIDIAANSGILSLLLVMSLFFVALIRNIKGIKSVLHHQDYFCCFVLFLAFLTQSLINANQISVNVWLWTLLGIVLVFNFRIGKRTFDNPRVEKNKLLPIDAVIRSYLGIFIGFVIAVYPFSTDYFFRKAVENNDIASMTKFAKSFGGNAWFADVTLKQAIDRGDSSVATNVVDFINSKYPRDNYAWKTKLILKTSDSQEREKALLVLKEIDPLVTYEIKN